MILQEINYKMPIYRDCTLGEILFVGMTVFTTLALTFSFIAKMACSYGVIGFALAFALFYPITKLLLGRLQKLKYGKPFGYYKHYLLKKLAESKMLKTSYLTRRGKWSVRRVK